MIRVTKFLVLLFLLCLLIVIPNSFAANTGVFELSLEELMDLEVTSVSKKKEKAREAPAAIFVITNEDIRRLGATSIPDLLRIVPGLQVAQMSSNNWAISSRGFNGQFTNDLLVLVDGRSVYSPIFSGVDWDVQHTILEDIERIEVIRGPGATVWGSNAVNGVINIITKSAKDTQGTYVSALAGNVETGNVEVRYGGKIDDDTYYRLYTQYLNKNETDTADNQDRNDRWFRFQTGFKVDAAHLGEQENSNLTVQGDIYWGENKSEFLSLTLTPPFVAPELNDEDIAGGNILARLERTFEDGSIVTMQTYFDHTRRNERLRDQMVSTVDFDFQHIFQASARNEIVWGTGYRYIRDHFLRNNFCCELTTSKTNYDIWSAFIQDEYEAIPDKLSLILGSKFEVNDYTGFEFQPSAKAVWSIDRKNTAWASISRAVRTPSRVADNVQSLITPIPPDVLAPGSLAGFGRIAGNNQLESEELTAYEVGYKANITTNTSLDVAAFYNRYQDLFTTERQTIFIEPASAEFPAHTIVPTIFDNRAKGRSYGVEILGNWNPKNNWSLSAGYAYHRIDIKTELGSTDGAQSKNEDNSPLHQFTLRSSYDFANGISMDNTLFFVDEINAEEFTTSSFIPSYYRLDTRVAWNPRENVELSIVGQNLLDNRHPEYAAPLFGRTSQLDRSVFGRIKVKY